MALFQEGGLEVRKDGKASFERKYLSIKKEVVPYTTCDLDVNVLHEYWKEPICEEERRVNLKCLEVSEKLWQYLLEVVVEEFDSQLNIFFKPMEQLQEQGLVHKVGKSNKGLWLLLAEDEEHTRQETHILKTKKSFHENSIIKVL